MITLLTPQALAELKASQPAPCLSLYLSTHRHHPDNLQDPIRCGQSLKLLDASLRQKHGAAEAHRLLAPFIALAEDTDFWAHTADGVAVFGAGGLFRVFHLQRPVSDLAIVAESFHTKPLRRLLQSASRYQVLALSLGKVRFYEGDHDSLNEIALAPGVPGALDEVSGGEPGEPHHTVSSYGGIGQGHVAMHHGQGGKKDQIDTATERFFRAVDRAVLEHHSRPSGLPLLLAALPQHHAAFRQVSHNPQLMEVGLPFDPEGVAIDELRARAWQAMLPKHEARLASLAEDFAVAQAKGRGSADLAQVAQAAATGRVASLLIEADRLLPGRLDPATGRVEAAGLDHPEIDDLLDDLGELVERQGGQVTVMPTQQMPSTAGLAAIYRH